MSLLSLGYQVTSDVVFCSAHIGRIFGVTGEQWRDTYDFAFRHVHDPPTYRRIAGSERDDNSDVIRSDERPW